MVIDSFLFFNELDLLEIRLNILDEYVDKFVLIESTETFSGLPKPLYYEQNRERFAKWNHKIVHHVVGGYTEEEWAEAKASPNTGGLDHWCREYIQRENIKKGLIKAGAKDEDIVFVGDVDEIWEPQVLDMFSKSKSFGTNRVSTGRLKLRVYSYWLNNRSSEEFWGSSAIKYWVLTKGPQQSVNAWRSTNDQTEEYRGWHFTSMGGVEALKTKIKSYGHQEFAIPEVLDNLEERLSSGKDFIGRDFQYILDESAWPRFLKETRHKYKHLIK